MNIKTNTKNFASQVRGFILIGCYSLGLILLLVGCSGGAVQFAPTPLPANLAPTVYEHPSGAFTLVLPPNWSVFSQNLTTLASASFAPPKSDTPMVRVAVVNVGHSIESNEMGEILLQYQTQIRPDIDRYTERDRNPLADGSWQLMGLRTIAGGKTEQINTFAQRKESLFSVIEVLLPTDTALRTEVQTIINTFELHPDATLPESDIAALSVSADSPIEVLNVATWTTADGILFVTGEVTNHGSNPVSKVPVRALQIDAQGQGIAEALDTIMGYTLTTETFLPFSLRFGQGQDPNASRFAVIIGDEEWNPTEVLEILTEDKFDWTDESNFNENGNLVITGTVSNIGLETARDTKVIVTVFDENQEVIAAGFTDVQPALLAGGETTDFTILVQDIGGNPATYIVTVQALPCGTACE